MDIAYRLTGKSIIFSDLHLGLRNNSVSRLNICIKAIREIAKVIKEEDIKNIFFAGDLFHNRKSLDLQVLNCGLKLIEALSKRCKCFLINGNHDSYYKNASDVNSINVFKSNQNVIIINTPMYIELNGKTVLLVPWMTDIEKFNKESVDIMMGHFDISSKFLIASYIEEHSKNSQAVTKNVEKMIDSDDLLGSIYDEDGTSGSISEEIDEIVKNNLKSADLVGSFVEIVKQGGFIYAGHIHNHKEFVAKKRNFIFIGSPYQQTFGEIDSIDGFYVLDENNKRKFIETTTVPKHVILNMTEILKQGIDKFDFSIVKGNIIKKVYDCEVDKNDEVKINMKINNYGPYEELPSDYDIVSTNISTDILTSESLEMIKKSKLEYIRSYISTIDKKILDEADIDPKKLFEIIEIYYNKAVDSKK